MPSGEMHRKGYVIRSLLFLPKMCHLEVGYVCVGTGGTWEISALSLPFCCEPKTALKQTKVLIK